MKAPISIKHKGEIIKGTVPTDWASISLKQFYQFTNWALEHPKTRDSVRMYEIMTGIPYDVLVAVKDSKVTTEIDSLIGFLWENPEDAKLHKYPVPKSIRMLQGIHIKDIEVPKQIEIKQLGQSMTIALHFENLKKELKDSVEFEMHRASDIIAIIMFQELTGSDDFNIDTALMYRYRILELPATIAVPLAVFFWNHYIDLTSVGKSN